jgi:hypothetical protein
MSISLRNNNISENGAKYISDAKWINISIINLGYNQISDKGIKYIVKACWKNLK